MIDLYETDQQRQSIDIQSYLIRNQPATIAVRCGNDSMKNAGIGTGDILIIDRSLEARIQISLWPISVLHLLLDGLN